MVQLKSIYEVSSSTNMNITWRNISVSIKSETSEKCLNNVSGYAKTARVLALMGPSGSGKSTLIKLLSGRLLNKNLSLNTNDGRIEINGHQVRDYRLLLERCGYVEPSSELGAFIQSITVREHLVF